MKTYGMKPSVRQEIYRQVEAEAAIQAVKRGTDRPEQTKMAAWELACNFKQMVGRGQWKEARGMLPMLGLALRRVQEAESLAV